MTFVGALFVTVALSNFSSLATQAPLESPRVDVRRIRQGLDSLAIFVLRGSDTIRTGTIWDEIQVRAGKILRTYRSTDRVLGERLDTIIDNAADLRAVAYRSRASFSRAHLDFTDTKVEGWVRPESGDSVTIDIAVLRPVFNAASFDLFVRSVDLRTGLQAHIPAFLTEANAVVELRARVTGAELVSGHACWVVEADFSGLPITLWVDRATRTLRRQLIRPPGGASVSFVAF